MYKSQKTQNQQFSTIIIVLVFSIILCISLLANKSACRVTLHRISSKIENIKNK